MAQGEIQDVAATVSEVREQVQQLRERVEAEIPSKASQIYVIVSRQRLKE